MPQQQSTPQGRSKIRLKKPDLYHVVMHNDDFTTMEFVVELLLTVFHKDKATATELMMRVHKQGRAIVGTYTLDIAQSKVKKAMMLAQQQGFPFRMTVEQA